MNNIFINARFLTQSITGVQRYAIELIKVIDNLMGSGEIDSSINRFILLAPKNIKMDLKLKNIQLKLVGNFKGHLWEQLELPFYTRQGMLLNLCNIGPMIKRNQIVTIHDAAVYAYPEGFSFLFRSWYKFLFNILGRRVRNIVTDSYFSKNELMKHCNIDENKLNVIYLGKEHIFLPETNESILDKYKLKSKKYILAVSSMNPNKNFRGVIKAIESMRDFNFEFVIAGGTNPKVFSESTEPLPDVVKHVGYVTDNELRVLYGNAACFIYPSFYEGFGLPPLEAMACGSPVIVSNVASLPEVCGDAALYCDPYDYKDIANKIKKIMNDDDLREDLCRKGLEHAQHFTWEKCAHEMIDVIEKGLTK